MIGTEAQRTTIERVAGVTFLPLSLAQPAAPFYLLAMRYTLANPTFDSAPQNIVQTGSAAAAAQTMGAYYPHAQVCSLSVLSARGRVGMWVIVCSMILSASHDTGPGRG